MIVTSDRSKSLASSCARRPRCLEVHRVERRHSTNKPWWHCSDRLVVAVGLLLRDCTIRRCTAGTNPTGHNRYRRYI